MVEDVLQFLEGKTGDLRGRVREAMVAASEHGELRAGQGSARRAPVAGQAGGAGGGRGHRHRRRRRDRLRARRRRRCRRADPGAGRPGGGPRAPVPRRRRGGAGPGDPERLPGPLLRAGGSAGAAYRAAVPAGRMGRAARAAAGFRTGSCRSGARRSAGSSWPTTTRGTCWRVCGSSRSRPRSGPKIRSTRWAATSGSARCRAASSASTSPTTRARTPSGSLVWFEAGRPRKSEYRKFKIEGPGQQDDFAAIQEVITRYLTRRRDEQLPIPDLILIDGGKGQLNAALEAAERLGLTDLQFASLAKREEEVFLPGRPDCLRLSRRSPVAAAAPAHPRRGASVRAGLQSQAPHPADDHLRAAQHPRSRPPPAPAAAGALRQPRGREVRVGLRAGDRAGILHPARRASPRAPPDPSLRCPSSPT